MNRWQCDKPGCRVEAVGVGGSIGLRAIGWYYHQEAEGIECVQFCPAHRPDPIPCQQEGSEKEFCQPCAGEQEARELQGLMPRHAAKQRATTLTLTSALLQEPAWPAPGGMGAAD